jgi:hypothetical protein
MKNNKLPTALIILWALGLSAIQLAPAKTLSTPVSPSLHNVYIGHIGKTTIPEWKVQDLPNPSLKYMVVNTDTGKLYEYTTAKSAKAGFVKHNAKHLTDIFVVGQS